MSLFKVYEVNVDTMKEIQNTDIRFSQGDQNTAKLVIQITHNGEKLNLTGYRVQLALLKIDNKRVYQECNIVDAENGVVEVILTTQSLVEVGKVQGELSLILDENKTMISTAFSFSVEKSIMNESAVKSMNESPLLQKVIKVAESIGEFDLANLTNVGERLEGFINQLQDNAHIVKENNLDYVLASVSTKNQIYFAGDYTLDANKTITKDLYIRSNNATVFGNGFRFNINSPNLSVTFENMNFNNVNFRIQNFKKIKFINCRAVNCSENFVDDFGNGETVEFDGFITEDLGTSITDTESGNDGVLNSGKLYHSAWGGGLTERLIGKNIKGYRGKSFGGCGFNLRNVLNIEIDGCHFYNCRHSPITFHEQTVEVKGFIKNCFSDDCSALVYSAPGANTSSVEVHRNTVLNSKSNAIEGTFKYINDNYIENTGLQAGVLWGCESEGVWISNTKEIKNNTIIGSRGAGLEYFSENTIADRKIIGNQIINSGQEGILLNSSNVIDAFSDNIIADNTIKGVGCINANNKRSFTLVGSNTTIIDKGIKFKNNTFENPVEQGMFLGVSFDRDMLLTKSPTFANSIIGSPPLDWNISNGTAIVKQKDDFLKYAELISNGSDAGCGISQIIDVLYPNARGTIVICYKSSHIIHVVLERYDVLGNILSERTTTIILPINPTKFKRGVIGIPNLYQGKIKVTVKNSEQSLNTIINISEFALYAGLDS